MKELTMNKKKALLAELNKLSCHGTVPWHLTKTFFSWHTIKRNLETIGAAILHGTGTPFKIIFNGLYYNK